MSSKKSMRTLRTWQEKKVTTMLNRTNTKFRSFCTFSRVPNLFAKFIVPYWGIELTQA